ncbi:MFS general substrate transporter [Yamadazyma tenuis ATCC 10573]|uniref:MFS general substrate transporter n=1 Tax=Candida tenuis (strain ATCC 10573 / BCRC 21748 / CBS 615 / JCM 9827 / NBRC 10315 / NRRL Y-1498 / VKM Y-70) TaxID=590646 RepID=G3BC47_CANTC|nr:MFS general substrate transporter [Yamadazyma tenuis ATCC 10573]EGV60784.1 MFS general substrate transporter [Yamadazyma tenuis ATCC 10573]
MTEHTNLTFKDQIKGFPLVQILVISFIKLAEPIAFTSIFPYAFYMIRDFGVAKSEAEISTYAGYLAAVFAFGQFTSAIVWGKFADVYGRKIVLILGLLGSSFSILLLGFSSNFWMAFLARGLSGLLNGNSGVSRSVIGEIAPHKHHQGLAFLSMPVAWNIGGVFGPLIGGTLSHPFRPDTPPSSAWGRLNWDYPYALPNMVIAAILIVEALITYFCLKETHPTLQYHDDPGINRTKRLLRGLGLIGQELGEIEVVEDEETLLLVKSKSSETVNVLEDGVPTADYGINASTSFLRGLGIGSVQSQSEFVEDAEDENTIFLVKSAESGQSADLETDLEPFEWRSILTPKVLNPILAYFIMQSHFTAFDEFLPIFVSYPPAYTDTGARVSQFPLHLKGGLGYTPKRAGDLLSSSGFFGMFMVLLVFPTIDRKFNRNTVFLVALGIFPLLFAILPYVLLFLPQQLDGDLTTKYADQFLYAFVFIRVMVASSLMTLAMVSINSNAKKEYRGIVNGAAISAASLAACISPLFTGRLMTVGQACNVAGLGWWGLGIITTLGFIQGCFIRVN